MNRSGAVIAPLLQRFGIDFTEFLVIHDDVHLPTGVLRLRRRGSSGGHNGLSSILEATGSRNIARLRVGVGISSSTVDLVEHVLSPFEREELPLIDTVLDKAADAVFAVLESGWDKAMNVYNTIQTNNQDAS
jgi:peptidyl-tRNA hydrolase, PTH1 family